MKRFLAISLLTLLWTVSHACGWIETDNYYMYSIIPYKQFSSEPTGYYEAQRPDYYKQIARYWADYIGNNDVNPYGYMGDGYADTVRMRARSLGDREMLTYTSWLNEYLVVSKDLTNESWNYTKMSPDVRTRRLTQVRKAAMAYKGKRLRQQYALLIMRCNMLMGANQRNITYWTTVGQKLPESMWREAMRNIYANALLRTGHTLQACNIYMEQGDYASVRTTMNNYRNLAGIQYIYNTDHNAPLLQFLIQSFVNRVQDATDALAQPASEDDEWGNMSRKKAQALATDARQFITMAGNVVQRGESKTPAMWASAAAWVEYLLGNHAAAATLIDKAATMEGTQRMHDNTRVLKLMISTATSKPTADYRNYVAGELEWIDSMIKEENGYADGLARNHYTDVRCRVLIKGMQPLFKAAGLNCEATAMKAANCYQGGTADDNDYCDSNYAVEQGADALTAYYHYITRQPADRLDTYLQSHVYRNKDYFCDLIGTHLIAEGRFGEAQQWLKQVPLSFISAQNSSRYAAKRSFTTPAWYDRQRVRDWSNDGPVDTRAGLTVNPKIQYCKYMEQTIKAYNTAKSAKEKTSEAYRLAVAYYQASVYGDCWYLTHYAKHVVDSARTGELDFAAQAIKYLNECKTSSDKTMQNDAYYALAFIPIDNWCDVVYDYNANTENRMPKPQSYRYGALANLMKFVAANPNDINMKTMKCDVLRQFMRAVLNAAQSSIGTMKRVTINDLTYNWRKDHPGKYLSL